MTAPCFYCGSAGACDHRTPEPPLVLDLKPDQHRQTDVRRYNFPKPPRDYTGMGHNFRRRRG